MDWNLIAPNDVDINGFLDFGQFGMPEGVIMIFLGVLVLFFGYRIKKIAFFVVWFLLGFNLVKMLMPMINNAVPAIADSDIYQILIPVAGGAILGMLGFTIEKLCVAGIAFALTMMVTVQYFGTETTTLIIGAVTAIAVSGIAVMMIKPAIIVLTAIAGAYAIVTALPNIWHELNIGDLYWPILGGLAILGTVVQFMTTKKLK